MKKFPFLKKKTHTQKKQYLKNEFKNQQAIIEMLITGDKFGNKSKVVKNDTIKVNTKKNSACPMPSKVLSPPNLQNRLNSLMVIEESSIENELLVQT